MSGRVICGDALEEMKGMESGTVGLVITSPPYNLRNTTGGGVDAPGKDWKSCGLSGDGYDGHDDMMPHDKYVAWQRECLTEMMRLIRDDGAIFYNHKWRVQGGLLQDRSDIMGGFPVRQVIIWHRGSGMNHNPHFYIPTYEVIYMVAKPGFRLVDITDGDVWRILPATGNPHPAPFPVELPERVLKTTSDNGPVLDPFMGSGTVAVAAERQRRAWIGIEKSEAYCGLARSRIAREGGTGQRRITE